MSVRCPTRRVRQTAQTEPPVAAEPEALPWRRPWFFLAVLLLAGYLLICHGCHGDEDNELFAVIRAALPGERPASAGW